MKSKLDQLESYLKNLIENSANLLWRDEHLDLVRKLIAAIESETHGASQTQVSVPNALIVQIHPAKYIVWQENKEIVDGLSAALQEAAVELDLPMKSRPVIYLEADPQVSENSLEIHIIPQEDGSIGTAILASADKDNSEPGPENEAKAFLILEDGEHFILNRFVVNIGRREGNELVIEDLHVSREHAQIRTMKGSHVLFDLNSKGGTFVNGRKVVQHLLQPGDVISLSGHPLIYVQENPVTSPDNGSGITHTTRLTSPEEDEEELS